MPIYEYKSSEKDENKGCEYCRERFEKLHKSGEPPLAQCPKCGGSVTKLISRVGVSYGIDYRAKGTGLKKLVRRDKGTYEQMY